MGRPAGRGKGRGARANPLHAVFLGTAGPRLHRAFEEKFGIVLLEAMGSTECGGNVFTNPLPPGKDKIGTPGLPVRL